MLEAFQGSPAIWVPDNLKSGVTTAHRYAPATVLAPFGYFQIIFMTASSWLIFNQPPDMWIYIGAPIVIGSGLYIWSRERALARPTTPIAEER